MSFLSRNTTTTPLQQQVYDDGYCYYYRCCRRYYQDNKTYRDLACCPRTRRRLLLIVIIRLLLQLLTATSLTITLFLLLLWLSPLLIPLISVRVSWASARTVRHGRTVRGTNDANDWSSSSSSSWRRRPRPTTVDTKTRQNTPAVYLHHLFRSVSIIGTTLLISGHSRPPSAGRCTVFSARPNNRARRHARRVRIARNALCYSGPDVGDDGKICVPKVQYCSSGWLDEYQYLSVI